MHRFSTSYQFFIPKYVKNQEVNKEQEVLIDTSITSPTKKYYLEGHNEPNDSFNKDQLIEATLNNDVTRFKQFIVLTTQQSSELYFEEDGAAPKGLYQTGAISNRPNSIPNHSQTGKKEERIETATIMNKVGFNHSHLSSIYSHVCLSWNFFL